MKASDVMVSNVITVGPNANVADVARLLLANRISAVPVIDDEGRLIGIVSEGDLMRRVEANTERRRSWFVEQFGAKQPLAADYVKSHSPHVSDIMTRKVITATPDTALCDIASLLEGNGIKRVPIVHGGKVVGIVSRANFLQVLASNAKSAGPALARDSEIRRDVIARLNAEPWRPTMLDVAVEDGIVDLFGFIQTEDERRAARVAVELTPGVKFVNDHLSVPPAITGLV